MTNRVVRLIFVKSGLNLRRSAAVLLTVAVAAPALILLPQSSSPSVTQLTPDIKGGDMSGWINDTPAFGGGGHDLWPTIVSLGDSIFVAFSTFDSGTGYYRIAVVESVDGGLVWTQIGDFSPGPHDCRYPVMTVYNGVLFVAFQFDVSTTDHDIYCYASSAGATGPWISYGVRTDSSDDYSPAIEAVVVANHPGVYVVFENRRGGADGTDLLIYKSIGDAFSFLDIVVGGSDAGEYTMADISVYQDELNPIIYVAFQNLSGGQHDICFVRSLNGGTTWSSFYQVTSSLNDEYAPSISVGYFYLLISYVMWNGDPDLYATIWDGASFGNPYPLSASSDYEGWPEVYNWFDDFYVVYARGATYTSGGLYIQSASGALNPYWSVPSLVSDLDSAADAGYRPALTLCDRPNTNFYFASAWGDFRAGTNNSDIQYSTQGCRYTVRTDPAGLTYQVDDVTYSSEQTFNWPAGFKHTLTATDGSLPFQRWDDGTNQWYTPTITPYALTNDVTPGMTAYYSVIPEFPNLVLPVIGVVGAILFARVWRRDVGSG